MGEGEKEGKGGRERRKERGGKGEGGRREGWEGVHSHDNGVLYQPLSAK